MKLATLRTLNLSLDAHLSPLVPPSQLHRLPYPLARLLGHRRNPPAPLGNVAIALWSLVGCFLGLLAVCAINKFSDEIRQYDPPVIIASLGAAAILDYNVISSPLSQPRSSILGHTLAATIGVATAKAFHLSSSPPGPQAPQVAAADLRWIAGPLACALTSFVMALTSTIYPPGGATAVLAATDEQIVRMGWMFVPLVLLGSCVMLGVALCVNNVARSYPVFWWSPAGDVGGWDVEEVGEVPVPELGDDELEGRRSGSACGHLGGLRRIVITDRHVLIPEGFALGPEQEEVLEVLRGQLRGLEMAGSEVDSEATANSHSRGGEREGKAVEGSGGLRR
ncbi:hypothetical protein K490DRAFT_42975 [Saccharata proteae CBS 121410]|uniref:HPP transmembrane region domain-containing protein n=1 Tax=Saccharata proteae CBS 121410 TaxID=1314787 RepID=A0A9P4LY72_9PEZI|nr:hypothetical protein K490DRAFT_42975 [Saccharata proteae CBS 121410]